MNDNEPSALNLPDDIDPISATIDGASFYRQPGETVAEFEMRCRTYITSIAAPVVLHDRPDMFIKVVSEDSPPGIFSVADLAIGLTPIAEPADQIWVKLVYEEYEHDALRDTFQWVKRSDSILKVSKDNGIAICQMILRGMFGSASGEVSRASEAHMMGTVVDMFPRLPLPLQVGARRLKVFQLRILP